MPFSELLVVSRELHDEIEIQREGDLDQDVNERRRKGVSSV